MASYTPTAAKHATLAAGVVDTITFPRNVNEVEILNRSSAEIYFTTDGSTPTVGGDNTFVVTAGSGLQTRAYDAQAAGGTKIKLISASVAAYSVTAL